MRKIFRKYIVINYFLIILLSIFTTHFLLSVRHTHFANAALHEIVVDAFLMTIIVFPILYYFFLKPLTQEIKVREKVQLELELAKEKAELSDRLKTDFLGQMSHEIRTPINQLLGFAQIIKEHIEIIPNSDLANYFEKLNHGCNRLIRTIESILEMSQLKTGAYKGNIEKINLKEILTRVVDSMITKIQDKELQVQLFIENKEYIVNGDKYGIEQIFRHLIENAIVFTKNGSIDIKLNKTDYLPIVFSISDTGIGISDEFLPKIFHPFSQEDQGYSRRFEGNGLGLALVKGYSDLINANIEIITQKGKGTTFRVTFVG